MAAQVYIKLNTKSYLRNPEDTQLGRNIIEASVRLIDELGFEAFTFKKLAERIGSTEASVYRYFENKHKLLTYLISWYWAWLEHRIDYETHNIASPEERLKKVIKVIAGSSHYSDNLTHVQEELLFKIVVMESHKAYFTKSTGAGSKEELFNGYISLSQKIAAIMKELNPAYAYTNSLATTLLEAAHNQLYFAEHLPSLTNVAQNHSQHQLAEYLSGLVLSVLNASY